MSTSTLPPSSNAADVEALIFSAKVTAESLCHLLRVAEEYAIDAFRPPMPAGYMAAFEGTMSLIDAAQLMAGKLDDILARAEAMEPPNDPPQPIACAQPRARKG